MQELNLFQIFTEPLNNRKIDYFITGSVAAIVYGEPRLTHDIDLVLNLALHQIDILSQTFPAEEFYLPPKDILVDEIKRETRGHFNIIHHESGFKADCYLLGKDELQIWALENRNKIEFMNSDLYIAPVEYVILKKLMFYEEGNANKHLEDIRGILKNSNNLINYDFLNSRLIQHGLNSIFEKCQKD